MGMGIETTLTSDFRDNVPGWQRATYAVRHRNGTYTSTVAHDLGVDSRTARRWLHRATDLGLLEESPGMPSEETFWDTVKCSWCGYSPCADAESCAYALSVEGETA